MKRSSILWSVFLAVICLMAIQYVRLTAAITIDSQPKWLTIMPALAFFVVFVAPTIRKEITAVFASSRPA